jgi:hypothetical protein
MQGKAVFNERNPLTQQTLRYTNEAHYASENKYSLEKSSIS